MPETGAEWKRLNFPFRNIQFSHEQGIFRGFLHKERTNDRIGFPIPGLIFRNGIIVKKMHTVFLRTSASGVHSPGRLFLKPICRHWQADQFIVLSGQHYRKEEASSSAAPSPCPDTVLSFCTRWPGGQTAGKAEAGGQAATRSERIWQIQKSKTA